jgi:tRNA-specific 2-thiouridylase
MPPRPAAVVDTTGRRIGEVPSVELVTVGQRKGLGIGGAAAPRYVVDVDTGAGVVTVGSRRDLLVAEQPLRDLRWTGGGAAGEVLAQCSAHAPTARATVDAHVLRWEAPQRRVAPGQSVVLYDPSDEVVLGGALAA